MIIYFVCLLFWILFSVCCVAVGKNSRKNNSLNSPFTIFSPGLYPGGPHPGHPGRSRAFHFDGPGNDG